MSKQLGQHLRAVRNMKGLSLRSAAEKAGISVAYLQKLEGGEVQQPSPKVLFRLGQSLGISYSSLMELAGYFMPERESLLASTNIFGNALESANLSEGEQNAVIAFITHLRNQRNE